jgi:hypothetical protein
VNRRKTILGSIVLTASGGLWVGTVACAAGQAAAPEPTATPAAAARNPQFTTQVQVLPQDARLGQDENVVIRVLFRNAQGRPVSGGILSAVVNYPGGPKTFTAEVSTFPDGRTELAVPVSPEGARVTRGSNVRVEVVMKYQGQEFRSNAGFNVR